jgi:hypothetical protein
MRRLVSLNVHCYSGGRIAVLVNPLGNPGSSSSASTKGGSAPEVISIKRDNLTVLEGHRRQNVETAKSAESDAEMPLESLRERIACSGPLEMIEGEQAVMAKLREGSIAASSGEGADYVKALECFEAALLASTEVHDNKSLIRVHIMVLCWQALTMLYGKGGGNSVGLCTLNQVDP